jgi:hypothetical protein
VGELYAAGVFADSIRWVVFAAFDSICTEPAARTAVVSKRVKEEI